MTRPTPFRRVLVGLLLIILVSAGCSVAREADRARPSPTAPERPVPTAIAPPQAQGLNGVGGAPPPNACTVVAAPVSSQLGVKATARPDSWNDGGLPAMDLCILMLRDRPVTIGVSALPRQSDSLDRLASAADTPEALPELSAEARVGPTGLVLGASDRAVRITMPSGLDRGTALTLGRVVQAAVPAVVKPARQSDGACQPSGATAEQFLGSRAQLRRDYRVDGALTCIWGTFDGTVSIVESFRPDSIPEARRPPPPKLAPIGNPGYYLPEEGELVFRQGKRVVRIAALTEPARTVNLDELLDIVEPIMPLFIR